MAKTNFYHSLRLFIWKYHKSFDRWLDTSHLFHCSGEAHCVLRVDVTFGWMTMLPLTFSAISFSNSIKKFLSAVNMVHYQRTIYIDFLYYNSLWIEFRRDLEIWKMKRHSAFVLEWKIYFAQFLIVVFKELPNLKLFTQLDRHPLWFLCR